MKILALSDTHVGAGYEHRRDALADTEAMFNQVADLAEERGVDLIVHAGDVFHRAKPTPEELHVFKRFCDRISILQISMIAISGNGIHEAAHSQQSALELFDSRYVRVSRRPERLWPEFANIAICTLPAATARGEEAIDLLIGVARDLFNSSPDDIPRVLLAHQMVSGASLPTGLPVEQIGSTVLPLWALEEIGYDAIILGDIHKNQLLGETTWYCGSPICMDFGEQDVDHGVWIFDTDEPPIADHALEFFEISDRRFVTVDVDLVEYLAEPSSLTCGELDETDLIAAEIAANLPLVDAVVRVRYTATENQHRRVDHAALQRLLEDAGIHKLYGGIQWLPVRESRARVTELDETRGPLEAVDLWAETQALERVQADGLRDLVGSWIGEA